MRAFVEFAGKQSQALVDIADHTAVASMSTNEYQQTLYAAISKSVSEENFTQAFGRITQDLVAASQGATTFGRLLELTGYPSRTTTGSLSVQKPRLPTSCN
ncbi:hypothetical protein [Bradyrhizobium sp. ARR65]|uniref:hypothetical protein n=1 Tax=Bradyrhizobium sp. ARR65 TaxID=1040989 RepID=UPI000465A99B|nr:hypothetical protein [Bradyrhizobium sp. ARR65]